MAVKRCLDDLASTITSLVNTSLPVGTVPFAMKVANITPKLKKTGLDQELLKKFRSVSTSPLSVRSWRK